MEKIKIGRKLLALAIAGVTLSGCSSIPEYQEVKGNLSTIVEENADNTYLDEISDLESELVDIYNNKGQVDETEDTISAINTLEERVEIYEELKNLELVETNELSKNAKEIARDLTYKELKEMIENVKNGDSSFKEKLECNKDCQILNFIKEEYESYLKNNGVNIAKDGLFKTIKGGAAQACDLDPEKYVNFKIPHQPHKDDEPSDVKLSYDDNVAIELNYLTIKSDFMLKSISTLYKLQQVNKEDKLPLDLIKESINLTKTGVLLGSEIEGYDMVDKNSYESILEKSYFKK